MLLFVIHFRKCDDIIGSFIYHQTARSEKFKSIIFGEEARDSIEIVGHRFDIIKAMIKYIYTANVANLSIIAVDLMVAAHEVCNSKLLTIAISDRISIFFIVRVNALERRMRRGMYSHNEQSKCSQHA